MTLPRYAARRDRTEPDIVDGLELCGWECVRLSSGSLPDLLVRQRSTGRLALLEIEDRRYTRHRSPEQIAMLTAWKIPIVGSLDEALKALGTKIT